LALRESTRRGWAEQPLRLVPAALIAAGSIHTYSFPALVWLVPVGVIWAALERLSAGGTGGGGPRTDAVRPPAGPPPPATGPAAGTPPCQPQGAPNASSFSTPRRPEAPPRETRLCGESRPGLLRRLPFLRSRREGSVGWA
jgi:hypothetical protein